jgi:hypothetical protein
MLTNGRWLLRSGRGVALAALTSAAVATLFATPAAATTGDPITVERPAGQVAVSGITVDEHGELDVTVVDTRSDDPGWTATIVLDQPSGASYRWIPLASDHSAAFVDSDGRRYARRVLQGDTGAADLASAPAGHGLGTTHLDARPSGAPSELSISVTVV